MANYDQPISYRNFDEFPPGLFKTRWMEIVKGYGTKHVKKKYIELAVIRNKFACEGAQEYPTNSENWRRVIICKVRKKQWGIVDESGVEVL